MSTTYPESISDYKPIYYAEFNRGDRLNEFTIFRRQFMYSEEEMSKIIDPDSLAMHKMCNEVHPWNIFTSEYGPDGCVPDKAWVKWMVDAMNEKFERDNPK